MRGCRAVGRWGALVLGLLVSSCGIFTKAVPPPCPPVAVLSDAANLVRYREGPGRDITDVLFEAKIARFSGGCRYSKNNTRVTVDLSVAIDVSRGPANRDRKARFDYFVAIPAFHPAPQGKRRFPISIAFPGNRSRVRVTDVVELEIPLAPGRPVSAYPVYIGFQLSPAEIKENRRRRAP